jgi:hypothetical protein
MQKLPFKIRRKEAKLPAILFPKFNQYLKSIGHTFSSWVREVISLDEGFKKFLNK